MKKIIISVSTFLLVSLLLAFSHHKWQRNEVIHYDVSGYYLYLPATFIYKDLTELKFYSYVDSAYKPTNEYCNYGLYKQKKGKVANKYSIGVAFGELPFFLIAHMYTLYFQDKFLTDGYSEPYQFSIAMSTIFWTTIGLFVLASFLRKKFSDNTTALSILIIGFGTNLFCYTWSEFGMSHALIFMQFACILYLTERWYATYKPKYALLLGIFLGWVLITRPVDFVIVLFPLFWSISNTPFQNRIQLWWKYKNQIILCACSCFIVAFIQFSYWKLTTSDFIHFSYEEEGFNFLNPQITNGLFSFRKGWFVYTPIALISFLGLVPLWQKEKGIVLPFVLFYLATFYLVFSWWNWWYGWGFGSRPLVESYAALSIVLAALIEWVSKQKIWLKSLTVSIFGFFIWLNIYQTQQYLMGAIPGDNMNQEFYWRVWNIMHPTEEDWKYFKK